MHIWPDSATLSEDGAAPGAGNSMFAGGNKGAAGMGSAMPGPMKAGEIALSRAESAALSAMRTEPDEKHGLRRARAESGLTEQQIKMLKRRADHALAQGITLKGIGVTLTPTPGSPEEPSLVRKAQRENQSVVEALHEQHKRSAYTLPPEHDYRFPTPSSMGEADGPDTVHSIDQTFLPRETRPVCARDDEDDVEETNSASSFKQLAAMSRRRQRRR